MEGERLEHAAARAARVGGTSTVRGRLAVCGRDRDGYAGGDCRPAGDAVVRPPVGVTRICLTRGTTMPRLFLLSPANASGVRAQQLLSPRAEFELARRVQSPPGAPMGEVFAFVSGLYFRGKLTYARRFAD